MQIKLFYSGPFFLKFIKFNGNFDEFFYAADPGGNRGTLFQFFQKKNHFKKHIAHSLFFDLQNSIRELDFFFLASKYLGVPLACTEGRVGRYTHPPTLPILLLFQ